MKPITNRMNQLFAREVIRQLTVVTAVWRMFSACLILMMGLAANTVRADYVLWDDTFDDGDLGVNGNGTGNGFTVANSFPIPAGKYAAETNGYALITGAGNGIARYEICARDPALISTLSGGTVFEFKGVTMSMGLTDNGETPGDRIMLVVETNATAGDWFSLNLNNMPTGFFVQINSDNYTNGTAETAQIVHWTGRSVLFYRESGVNHSLGSWVFDNLRWSDPGPTNFAPVLDVKLTLTTTGYALDITGDTADGGNPVHISDTYANAGISPNLGAEYHMGAGDRSGSPTVSLAVDEMSATLVGDVIAAQPKVTTPDYPYNTNHVLGGEVAIFEFQGSSAMPLTYQWQIENPYLPGNWSDISGATSSNLVFDTRATPDGYAGDGLVHSVRVVVNDGVNPAVTSPGATIEVDAGQLPMLVTDISPSGYTGVYTNSPFTYSGVTFSGSKPVSIRWQKSSDGSIWSDLPGETNDTYTVAHATLADAGYYRLAATNQFGEAFSSSAQKYVQASAAKYVFAPAFTPFATLSAESVLTNFPSTNKIVGALVALDGGDGIEVTLTNAGNQKIAFAPLRSGWANVTAANTAANQFFFGSNTKNHGNSEFNTINNSRYTQGMPFTITLNNLIIGKEYEVQLCALDDSSANNRNRPINWQDPDDAIDTSVTYLQGDHAYITARFTATSSTERIQENGLNGANQGNFTWLVLRTVGWNPSPYMVRQPGDFGANLGGNASVSGKAAGDTTIASPNITYQWASGTGGSYTPLVDGVKYGGSTSNTLTIINVDAGDATKDYVLIASNGGGSTTSSVAKLKIHAAPATGSYAAYVMSNNPVAFWLLDETSNPTNSTLQAFDLTGNGRSGIYGTSARNAYYGVLSPQPATFPGFDTGQGAWENNLGVNANGTPPLATGTLIKLPPLGIDTNSVDTTIAMWIRPTAQPGNSAGLIYSRDGAGTSGLGTDNSGFGFGTATVGNTRALGYIWQDGGDASSTYTYNAPFGPPRDVWSLVAIVVESNQATFYCYYVDTNTMAPVLLSDVNTTTHLPVQWNGSYTQIGADSYNNYLSRIFPGDISSVAMFKSALSQSKIQGLFQGALGLAGLPPGVGSIAGVPASQSLYEGLPLTFTVSGIYGSEPLSYQWQHEGTNVIGETTDTLYIPSASEGNLGVYSFIVTNLYGSVTSTAPALLAVVTPPATTNLLGHWFVGETNLEDTANYAGAHRHDGFAWGSGVHWEFRDNLPPGKTGMAPFLYGGTSIAISNSSSLDANFAETFNGTISNRFTVMLWASGLPTATGALVSKDSNGGLGWSIRRPGDFSYTATFTMQGTGTAADATATTATLSSVETDWHHYAGTYDVYSGIRAFYIDGQLEVLQTGNGYYGLSPDTHLDFGGRDQVGGAGPDNGYNINAGSFYDARVYDAALTQDQIVAIADIAPPAPTFTYSVTSGNQLVIEWPSGVLLEATNILGPWTTNSATSPYTNDLTGAQQYFRIQN